MNSTVVNETMKCASDGTGVQNLIIIGLLVIVIICGILGNVAIVFVVLRHNQMRSLTNLIIASISTSCIISSIFCAPLDIYRLHWGYGHWKLPEFLCKIFWMLEMGTNFTFAVHIALFALYRLRTILNPYKVFDVSRVKLFIVMGGTWFVSYALSTPALFFAAVRSEGDHLCSIASCSIKTVKGKDHNYITTSFFVIFSMVYFLILLTSFTFCCCSCCGNRNRGSEQSQQAKECKKESTRDGTFSRGIDMSKAFSEYKKSSARGRKKVFVSKQQKENFKQFLCILASFLIGYTPVVVSVMIKLINSDQFIRKKNQHQQYTAKWTNLFTRIGALLFFAMVMLGTKKIRVQITALLKSFFCRRSSNESA